MSTIKRFSLIKQNYIVTTIIDLVFFCRANVFVRSIFKITYGLLMKDSVKIGQIKGRLNVMSYIFPGKTIYYFLRYQLFHYSAIHSLFGSHRKIRKVIFRLLGTLLSWS